LPGIRDVPNLPMQELTEGLKVPYAADESRRANKIEAST